MQKPVSLGGGPLAFWASRGPGALRIPLRYLVRAVSVNILHVRDCRDGGCAMSVDRGTAGERLAHALAAAGDRAGDVVAGIPKGGAVIGAKVALELRLVYECIPVCRVGMPCFPELTLAAIDPAGAVTFDPHTELTRYQLTRSRGELADALREQVSGCRGDRVAVDFDGRTIIVVDDAAETYIVAQAAAEYLRHRGAESLVFATPVAADTAMPYLRQLYDEVVVSNVVPQSRVVGFYAERVPSDAEIHDCMVRAWDASPEKVTV